MRNVIYIFLTMLMISNVAYGEELYMVLNGKAIHKDKGNYNESNYGLGFEYDMSSSNSSYIPFVGASSFKDSNSQTSNYIGGGYKYRMPLSSNSDGWRIDAGIMGFVMTRKDYNNNSPFLGALPFISVGTGLVMMNATYIPKFTSKGTSLIYLQLKFRVAEFD